MYIHVCVYIYIYVYMCIYVVIIRPSIDAWAIHVQVVYTFDVLSMTHVYSWRRCVCVTMIKLAKLKTYEICIDRCL